MTREQFKQIADRVDAGRCKLPPGIELATMVYNHKTKDFCGPQNDDLSPDDRLTIDVAAHALSRAVQDRELLVRFIRRAKLIYVDGSVHRLEDALFDPALQTTEDPDASPVQPDNQGLLPGRPGNGG